MLGNINYENEFSIFYFPVVSLINLSWKWIIRI